MSGDGRFLVFESKGDIATVNPRNSDHNNEIFLLDYAQRRIFQITNTKSLYYDDKQASEIQNNIRVEITNSRPQISNDGRWIIFGSNATTARPAAPDSSNPSSFDPNTLTAPTPTPVPTASPTPTPAATPTPGANPLTQDGNMEMWLYQVPAAPPVADLSLGDEQPLTDLSTGTFTRLTNTDPSQLPRPGSSAAPAVVADDNHDGTINDNGNAIAFVSNRDLVPSVGNAFPTDDNDEIYTYVRSTGALQQVTKTPRGTVQNPIYSKNPSISGSGLRVSFSSTGDNPVVGMSGGNNPSGSRNEEIFYADLSSGGTPIAGKQVTVTTPTNPGDVVNILDYGRRLSRDGRFIAFDSTADLGGSGANHAGYALFVYDITTASFRQVGPRSDADTAATGGDVNHYPGFTDYDGSGVPQTLVLETRENIKSDGTVAGTASDGLNPDVTRPPQIYSYQLGQPSASAKFTRLTTFPPVGFIVGEAQPLPSNSLTRMGFTLPALELGTGNPDLLAEVYYLLKPNVTTEVKPTNSYFTGATKLPVANATPAATPVASPSPTPVTPANVLGMSPGMLGTLEYTASDNPIAARTAVGDLLRSPVLPAELSGVTLTINGDACLLKSVNGRHIDFIVPRGLVAAADGSKSYPFVLINNGVVMRGTMAIVPARPDIFRIDNVQAPGGRTKAFNVTNPVSTQEPFVIKTVEQKGGTLVPSIIRVYVTGVQDLTPSSVTVRFKDKTLTASNIVQLEPGVWGVDVTLTADMLGQGESQVVVTATVGSGTFTSRLDDTTSFVKIL